MSSNNTVTLTGGLVSDPDRIPTHPDIVKIRLGVDNASNDKSNTSGYFNVTIFLNSVARGDFVRSQINDGKMKKGSQVCVTGTLVHERWQNSEGKSESTVVIYADSITYAVSSPRQAPATTETSEVAEAKMASVPDEF